MIVAFAGQKGGGGKSTLAVCTAAELAARGRSVLLVDADPQGSASTWHDVATEKVRQRAKESGRAEDEEGSAHALPSVVAMTGTLHERHQLPKLARPYDDVIIDTPGRMSEVIRSALMVVDTVVLPCGPSHVEAWALADTIKLIKEAQIVRRKLKAVIVINRKRAGTVLGESARDDLKASGLPILKCEIGLRQAFAETLGAGLGITAYDPHGEGAAELRALVAELEQLAGRGGHS